MKLVVLHSKPPHQRVSMQNCYGTVTFFLVCLCNCLAMIITYCGTGIFATASDIQNVSAEILKMYKFDHPNVMQLIGVCVAPSSDNSGTNGLCIVMPFMSKGSLLDYLRKEAEDLHTDSEEDYKVSD